MRRIKALLQGEWDGSLIETAEVRSALLQAAAQRPGGGITDDRLADFPPAPGRYHLYVSFACPWAHRTILYRRLKRLENVISMSVLHPRWAGPDGWRFGDSEMSTIDHVGGHRFLYQVYCTAQRDYTGRVTVPVLWDKETSSIVSNESADIMRLLNRAFDTWGDASVDFYPSALRSEIDRVNARVLAGVCRAVYRVGFAATQSEYENEVVRLFENLDELDARLSVQSYLCGETVTESDWHLFTALCRFDAAYSGALNCNLKRLVDFPALRDYTRRIHDLPGVSETVRFDHIKLHYYDTIDEINRSIVPLGPVAGYLSDRPLPRPVSGDDL